MPALPAVFAAELITIRCFRTSAPKAGNGFVAQENCFVATRMTKQFFEKFSDFNGV
jgi:hypothetical protein